jgi:hypothetical protein
MGRQPRRFVELSAAFLAQWASFVSDFHVFPFSTKKVNRTSDGSMTKSESQTNQNPTLILAF